MSLATASVLVALFLGASAVALPRRVFTSTCIVNGTPYTVTISGTGLTVSSPADDVIHDSDGAITTVGEGLGRKGGKPGDDHLRGGDDAHTGGLGSNDL